MSNKFIWTDFISNIPQEWKAGQGKKVKIAFFDSGVHLTHPYLSHLDVSGRKFDVTDPGFDLNNIDAMGDGDVTDVMIFNRAHGTQCASIISGQLKDDQGVEGIVPQAQFFIIKVADSDGFFERSYFIKAMKVALHLGVDVIAASSRPDPSNVGADELDQLMTEMADRKIIFVNTLTNADNLTDLNNLLFPADRPEVIVNGVLKREVAIPLNGDPQFAANISTLFPEAKIRFADWDGTNTFPEGRCSSSHATACLAGIIALLIDHLKHIEGVNYQARSKEEVMQQLAPILNPFNLMNFKSDTPLPSFNLKPAIV